MDTHAAFMDEQDSDYQLARTLCTAAQSIRSTDDEPSDLAVRLMRVATAAWERHLERERCRSCYLAVVRDLRTRETAAEGDRDVPACPH